MRKKKIAVVGGGASGIAAALTAAQKGAEVTILEGNDRVGKKILATGNGKCNLGNLYMDVSCFHTDSPDKLTKCLKQFGTAETIQFFEELGLMIKEKNGYLYPLCEQAAVVLDVLRFALQHHGICVKTEVKVCDIRAEGKGFFVFWKKKCGDTERGSVGEKAGREYFDRVILCCGSKAAPKTGSDGSGYQLSKKLGHSIVPVVPSLVQLRCSDSFCKALSGIRAESCIHILEGERILCSETGEIQLTDYGISGIPVFQLSAQVNRLLAEQKHGEITAQIDFLPGVSKEEFDQMKSRRMAQIRQAGETRTEEVSVEAFFTGMLNKKLMMLFIKQAGLNPGASVHTVPEKQLEKVFDLCKCLKYHIIGHNGFENAQVCSGGVSLKEVTEELESVKQPGIFFAGELLHVDGRCGGYNLQWAWTSGVIAGRGVCND